jgi:outer membrane protein assembly factor BamB
MSDSNTTLRATTTRYHWQEPGVALPEYDLPGNGAGRTHGVVCLPDGRIVLFRQCAPSVLIFNAEGQLLDSWGEHFGAHGMTLVEEAGESLLWLTDEFSGTVEKRTLAGELKQKLAQPTHAVYQKSPFIPTWVAVHEERFGGDGSIWLADGYGAQVVHVYDKSGDYRFTLDGSTGVGSFKCPHAVNCLVSEQGNSEFYIADRGNRRFQVFAPDGSFIRSFGDDFLTSPCCIVSHPEGFVVPELFGSLALLNPDMTLRDRLGENTELDIKRNGWANVYPLKVGEFNTPHSTAVDKEGRIFVVEWRVGGRVICLTPGT